MKKTFVSICLAAAGSLPASFSVYAQNTTPFNTSLHLLSPPVEYDNIHSQKLGSDSLCTGFVIWIKTAVKAHKHIRHTETIYVLEGTGTMNVGGRSIEIKPGDYLFIPAGTPHSLRVTSASPVKVLSVQSPEFNGDDRVMVE